MIRTKRLITDYEKKFGIDFTLPEFVCVINSETGNDQLIEGVWRPDKGFATCVGFFRDSRIEVFTRTAEHDPEFENELKFWLDFLKAQAHELWAFNSTTEAGNLFALFGEHYPINEIQPQRFMYRKDTMLMKLVGHGIIQSLRQPMPLLVGREPITLWEKYLKDPKTDLNPLIEHTISNMLKEGLLYKYKDALKEICESEVKR
ncbi:hypothetical protein MUP79_08665 [Candidatus Bathyarchaeota archaeon]|nr:hypothetical protein [Candidatus Bathyarchaeota archaeon]